MQAGIALDLSIVIIIMLNYKLVTKQYKDEEFTISNLKSIMFDDEGSLSVAFDPESVPGWERDHNGFHTEEVDTYIAQYFMIVYFRYLSQRLIILK